MISSGTWVTDETVFKSKLEIGQFYLVPVSLLDGFSTRVISDQLHVFQKKLSTRKKNTKKYWMCFAFLGLDCTCIDKKRPTVF